MGSVLRNSKLSPYEVKKEVDNYENTSLFDNMFINGKQVGPRKARRAKRREQAQQRRQAMQNNQATSGIAIQKNSDMVKKAPKQASVADNSEEYMITKKAALIKLATIKLAINYILRNRGLSKQADAVPGGFNFNFSPGNGSIYGNGMGGGLGSPITYPTAPKASTPQSSARGLQPNTNQKPTTGAGVFPGLASVMRWGYNQFKQPIGNAFNYIQRGLQTGAGVFPGLAPVMQWGYNQLKQPVENVFNNIRQGIQNRNRSGVNATAKVDMPTTMANGVQQMKPPAFTPPSSAPLFQSRNPISGDKFNQLSAPRNIETLRQVVGPVVRNNDGTKTWNSKTNTYNFGEGDWDAYQRERDRIESGWGQMEEDEREKYRESYDNHIRALDAWKEMQELRDSSPDTGSYEAPDSLDPGVPSLEPAEYDSAWEIPDDYDAMRDEFLRGAPAGETYNYGPNVGAPRNPQEDIQRGAIRRPGLG